MPSATVGGGFTSRCVFVYADRKEKYVAYVDESVSDTDEDKRADLIHDLEYISLNLAGPYSILPEARAWGRDWYQQLWEARPQALDDDRLDGYMARKQTHMHKLAMVIAASQRDALVITKDDLIVADHMLRSVEDDLGKVFSRIGRTEDSLQADRFIQFIRRKKSCSYAEAYRHIHAYFPDFRDFEGIIAGAVRSNYIKMEQRGIELVFTYIGPEEAEKKKAGDNVVILPGLDAKTG